MKKFFLLSFLMVAFGSAVSFAQTRVIKHYDYDGLNTLRYIFHDNTPNDYLNKSFAVYTGVSIVPPGGIDHTVVYAWVQNKDGSESTYFDECIGNDFAEITVNFNADDVREIYYDFEVYFNDGTVEIYEITDTYSSI